MKFLFDYDSCLTAETAFQEWLDELTPDQQAEYLERVEQDRQRDQALAELEYIPNADQLDEVTMQRVKKYLEAIEDQQRGPEAA